MPPKKGAKKPGSKAYKFPEKIAQGQVLTDVARKQWRLGKSVGQGGFGEIYLASDITDRPVSDDANFVIKVEPHSNGPLFTEMHCYMRVAKPDFIENWKKEKKLKRLGMPKYLGSGSHEFQGQKYRFMVMERFGDDLQKIIERHNKKFSYKTVFQIVIQILDVLEYIHSYEYIHADIKASNLLVGYQPGTENQVFLVDYGLACRYKIDGKHKEYKFDQRKAHDGTIEFTSRDAHIGAHSRRGDLEILGYNLVQWLSGKLPWEDKLQDCNYVAGKKRALMDDVPKFMNICFQSAVPPGIQEFVEYVATLTFDEQPNYDKCRNILREGLKKRGYKDDGKMVFKTATPKSASKLDGRKVGQKRRAEDETDSEEEEVSPPRKMKSGAKGAAGGAAIAGANAKGGAKKLASRKKLGATPRKRVVTPKAKASALTAAKKRGATPQKKVVTPKAKVSGVGVRRTQQAQKGETGDVKESPPARKTKLQPQRFSRRLSLGKETPSSPPDSPKSTSSADEEMPSDSSSESAESVETPKRSRGKGKVLRQPQKTSQTRPKARGQKRAAVCNGSEESCASGMSNPTPHMLALMERLKKA